MAKLVKLFIILPVLATLAFLFFTNSGQNKTADHTFSTSPGKSDTADDNGAAGFPMFFETLRKGDYPGSQLVVERSLLNGSNYRQFVASYKSEGLKINGLLTVPTITKPEAGFPAIIFVHGYIPPDEYSTTGNYASYQAVLARNSFVTFKPDLRGHGDSEGEPVSAHFSEKYVVDVLNAIATLKQYEEVDPDRIGYWGHSNGGETGLRAAVISADIKAAVFWAGVVGSFKDMLETYNAEIPFLRDRNHELLDENGLPSSNPEFWNKLDPYSYLNSIIAPIQLHHGTADTSVPFALSVRLNEELQKINKTVEYYEYPGDDHNLSRNFNTAWQRTINFFNVYLK